MKEETRKKREKIKENLKQFEKAAKYDENGKKRSKKDINQMMIKLAFGKENTVESIIEKETIKRKFNVKKIKQKVIWDDGREVERVIECDFNYEG